MSDKKIHYDSPEAATYTTGIEGWVSSRGHFYGKDEHLARFDGCTHRTCDKCGSEYEVRAYCEPCRVAYRKSKFDAMESIEWDGGRPLALHGADTYFFSTDDLLIYCEEHDVRVEDLQLVFCSPNYGHEIDEDYFCDELCEDAELPDCIQVAMDALNKAIREAGPLSWYPGTKRAIVKGSDIGMSDKENA